MKLKSSVFSFHVFFHPLPSFEFFLQSIFFPPPPQHLMFKNEVVKRGVRQGGGIPPLLRCLDSQDPVVRKNACKALKNLSHMDRQTVSTVR